MTGPGKSVNDVAEAFSLHAEDYDRWFDEPTGRRLFESEVKAVRILMKELCPPFLEIGVGSGRFAAALGIRYGVEPSEALLEMAKKRGVKAERAFGEKIPFPGGIFGGVLILFTLCFVKEPKKVIAEAKRGLRNDGSLIIGIINKESRWGELYQTKKAAGHPIYRHARFYSISEVEALMKDSGLVAEAYSSALCLSDTADGEAVHDRLVEDAGFICVRARKKEEKP